MSTTFEIGRCPAAIRRCFSHSGEGPIFTSSNTRAVKRRQISGSAISTLAWSSARSSPDGSASRVGRVLGERRGRDGVQVARHAVDTHRVRAVRRDLDLEHLVDDRQVLRERSADRQRSSRTMIPSWSSPIPTSSSARIIPCDSTPRSFALPSFVPSGMTAPGRATATVCPAATFGAPQTIVLGSPAPMSTVQTVSRSASGCRSAVRTLPTTNSAGSPTPDAVQALELEPRHRERVGDLLGRQAGVAVLAQPCDRDPHAPNCSSRRASFS